MLVKNVTKLSVSFCPDCFHRSWQIENTSLPSWKCAFSTGPVRWTISAPNQYIDISATTPGVKEWREGIIELFNNSLPESAKHKPRVSFRAAESPSRSHPSSPRGFVIFEKNHDLGKLAVGKRMQWGFFASSSIIPALLFMLIAFLSTKESSRTQSGLLAVAFLTLHVVSNIAKYQTYALIDFLDPQAFYRTSVHP